MFKQTTLIALALFATGAHACGCSSNSIENAGKVTGKAFATSTATSPNSSSYSFSTGTNFASSNGSYTKLNDGLKFDGAVKTSTEGYAFNTSTEGATGGATLDGTAIGRFNVKVMNPNSSSNYVRGGGNIDAGYETDGAGVNIQANRNTGATVLATGDFKITGEGNVGNNSSHSGKSVYGNVKTTNTGESFTQVGKTTVDGVVLQSAPAKSVSDGVATTWAKFYDPQ